MKEYSLSELKSSHLQYDKDPPKFVLYFVVIMIVFIVVIGVYSANVQKEEVLHTTGNIDAVNESYIQSPISGTVSSMNIDEGAYVSVGDTLFTVVNKDNELQLQSYTSLCDYYYSLMENYIRMQGYLKEFDVTKGAYEVPENCNPFDDDTEHYYYMLYKNFLTEIDGLTVDENIESKRADVVNQYIYDCQQAIDQYEPTYKQYEVNKKLLTEQIESGIVRADRSGYVHYPSDIKTGQYIDQSVVVLTISDKVDRESCHITAVISATDRAKIDIGTNVHVSVYGYSRYDYGVIDGTVTAIGSDTVKTDDGSYYKVSICIKDVDDRINLTNGMLTDCSVVYSEQSWLEWALDGLGIHI